MTVVVPAARRLTLGDRVFPCSDGYMCLERPGTCRQSYVLIRFVPAEA